MEHEMRELERRIQMIEDRLNAWETWRAEIDRRTAIHDDLFSEISEIKEKPVRTKSK